MISLDISTAFDCIWHKGLLAKLPMLGLTLITWIASLLFDTSIAIRVDSFLSTLHSINSGVPQGSFTSLALFILYVNDLLFSTPSRIFSFADDTYLRSFVSSNPQHLAYSSRIFSFADDTYLRSFVSSNPQHLAYSNISPHGNISASLPTNNLINAERWDKFNKNNSTGYRAKQTSQRTPQPSPFS